MKMAAYVLPAWQALPREKDLLISPLDGIMQSSPLTSGWVPLCYRLYLPPCLLSISRMTSFEFALKKTGGVYFQIDETGLTFLWGKSAFTKILGSLKPKVSYSWHFQETLFMDTKTVVIIKSSGDRFQNFSTKRIPERNLRANSCKADTDTNYIVTISIHWDQYCGWL